MQSCNRLTRRRMLQWSASSLLAARLWPGRLHADEASETFRFLVVNDTHYLSKKCGDWLLGVVRQMKAAAEPFDFCLLAGDLTDHGTAEELAAVRDVFQSLGKPVYAVLGNHDYRTQTDKQPYEQTFPERINYHFEHRGWQFVCLDTTEGQRYQKTKVQPTTLAWLDETMPKLDKKRPTVVMTHFPLGPRVTNRPVNADDLLACFKEHNLVASYGGHFHAFTERTWNQSILTTNRCCALSKNNHDGSKEKGFFVCTARNGTIERKFVEVK